MSKLLHTLFLVTAGTLATTASKAQLYYAPRLMADEEAKHRIEMSDHPQFMEAYDNGDSSVTVVLQGVDSYLDELGVVIRDVNGDGHYDNDEPIKEARFIVQSDRIPLHKVGVVDFVRNQNMVVSPRDFVTHDFGYPGSIYGNLDTNPFDNHPYKNDIEIAKEKFKESFGSEEEVRNLVKERFAFDL